MKLVIDIPDDKAGFGLKVLKSLSFIKAAKPISSDAVELWENLEEAAEEIRLHKQGKLKLKTAQQLLDEL